MKPLILIVDDEVDILKLLDGALKDEGFDIKTARNGFDALKEVRRNVPDLILMDILMEGISGMDTLREIRKISASIPVILVSGHLDNDLAHEAGILQSQFIEKPLDLDIVITKVNEALRIGQLNEEELYLRKKYIDENSITGSSDIANKLRRDILIMGSQDDPVLISGESGVGKEFVAKMLHYVSSRSDAPWIDVTCSSIREDHFAGILFGHEAHAFPHAPFKKMGLLEQTGSGTIFLDEINSMPKTIQSKLLKVIDSGKFKRIGGEIEIDFNARIIASSTKKLPRLMDKGLFSKELFYRLNVLPIFVAPLRKRREDIPELTLRFLGDFIADEDEEIAVSDAAFELLKGYRWPGNVRELKNALKLIMATSKKSKIDKGDIPAPYNGDTVVESDLLSLIDKDSYHDAMKAFKTLYLKQKISCSDESVEQTLKNLGILDDDIKRLINSGDLV